MEIDVFGAEGDFVDLAIDQLAPQFDVAEIKRRMTIGNCRNQAADPLNAFMIALVAMDLYILKGEGRS